jgi:hypothetical protein
VASARPGIDRPTPGPGDLRPHRTPPRRPSAGGRPGDTG